MSKEIKQVERIKRNLQYYISKNKFNKKWQNDSDSYIPLTPSSSRRNLDKVQKKNPSRQQDKKRGANKSKTPQFKKNLTINTNIKDNNSNNNTPRNLQRKSAMPKGFSVTEKGRIVKTKITDQQQTDLFNQIISKNKNGKLEQVIKNMSKNKKKKGKSSKSQSNLDIQQYQQMKVVISNEDKLGKQQTVYKKPHMFSNITEMLQKNAQKEKQLKEKQQKQRQQRQKQIKQRQIKQRQIKQRQAKQKQNKQKQQQNSNFFSILKLFGGNLNKVQPKKETIVQKIQKKIQQPKKVQNKQVIKADIPELIQNVAKPSQKNANEKINIKDRQIKQQNSDRFRYKTDTYYDQTMSDRQRSQKSQRSLKVYPTINFTQRQQHQLRSKYWNLNSKLDQLKNKIKQQCYDTYKNEYEKQAYQQTHRSRELDAAGLYKKYSPLKKLRRELQKRQLIQDREQHQKSLTKQLKLQQILRTQDKGEFPERKKRYSQLYYSQRSKLNKNKENSSSAKR